jgi:hypothetical protein
MDEKKDYEVGYGRPPESTRFKKGESGNRRGRPKGARGLKTDLKAELNEKVTITENAKSRKLTKQRIVVKQLMKKAASGDIRAISKLIDIASIFLGVEDEPGKGPVALSAADDAILKGFLARNSAEGFEDGR